MANRRTIGGVILNESIALRNGSPLRRQSMNIISDPQSPADVPSNNDDHERIARRRQSRAFDGPRSTENNSRLSLGLGGLTGNDLNEHYNKCLRLCAENKITAKNVFALGVIDYMAIINKRDATTNSMQTAQATLDVSTKIYSLRVDCVHSEVLKMAGNPAQQGTTSNDEEAQNVTNASGSEEVEKKTKRRRAQKILTTSESLCASAEVHNRRSAKTNSDSQTTDLLLQVTYPLLVHSGHSLHLYEDLLLEIAEENEPEVAKDYPEDELEDVEDIEELEICPMLEDFRILGWSEADIPDSPSPPNTPYNGGLRFDLDASLVADNDDNQYAFDVDDESHENVDRCRKRPEQAEHLVDFVRTITETSSKEKTLEYSYLREGGSNLHWAGPGHWKPHGLQRSIGTSIGVGVCGQEKRRRKQKPDLVFSSDLEEDTEYKLSRKGKNLQNRTVKNDWPEDRLLLPDDVHFEPDEFTKFHYSAFLKSQLFPEPQADGETRDDHEATILEDVEYNYNNDNDTQDYCSQNPISDELENGDIAEEFEHRDENLDPDAVPDTQAFTGDNLVVAPKSTQQIQIQYATRAKKVNMKQLKDGMWKCLKFPEALEDLEEEEGRKFSQTYKKLALDLGSEKSRALSIGLAFSSLLHLASEKNLSIKSINNLTDLEISQNRRLENS